jgi:cytochrome c-type biogenesis protein CcmH/NrfG
VIAERPSDETALLYLGVALVTSRKAENSMQGIMTLRKVLEINPDHVEANFQLGVFSLQTNQLEKAVQRFEKVLSLDPAYQPARFQLAVVRIRQQQPESARALLEQIIQEASEPDMKLEARELLQTIS